MKKIAFVVLVTLVSFLSLPVMAISETQKDAVTRNCNAIRVKLKNLQKTDAKARVYLGGHYENVLSKYITPLNLRLVENNVSNVGLIENQNSFANTKNLFASDFINYQQDLEELITLDCKNNPEEFYDKLTIVRKKREIVEQDILRMKKLMSEQMNLVRETRGKV